MKLSRILVLLTAVSISGGLGFLIGSLTGRVVWTLGDGVPMGICLTTAIAKQQGAMTQAEIDRVLDQARTKVQTAADRVISQADFDVNCPEALGGFFR